MILLIFGGPREEVSRLYGAMIQSMAFYAAPTWAKRLLASSCCRNQHNQALQVEAIRIVLGYSTISPEAATVLARFPPFNILVFMDAKAMTSLVPTFTNRPWYNSITGTPPSIRWMTVPRVCPKREVLVSQIERDLFPTAIIAAMLVGD